MIKQWIEDFNKKYHQSVTEKIFHKSIDLMIMFCDDNNLKFDAKSNQMLMDVSNE